MPADEVYGKGRIPPPPWRRKPPKKIIVKKKVPENGASSSSPHFDSADTRRAEQDPKHVNAVNKATGHSQKKRDKKQARVWAAEQGLDPLSLLLSKPRPPTPRFDNYKADERRVGLPPFKPGQSPLEQRLSRVLERVGRRERLQDAKVAPLDRGAAFRLAQGLSPERRDQLEHRTTMTDREAAANRAEFQRNLARMNVSEWQRLREKASIAKDVGGAVGGKLVDYATGDAAGDLVDLIRGIPGAAEAGVRGLDDVGYAVRGAEGSAIAEIARNFEEYGLGKGALATGMDATDWVDPTVEYGLGSNIASALRGEEFDPAMLGVEIGLAAVPVKGLPSVFSVGMRALFGKSLTRSMIMDARNAAHMGKALNILAAENPERFAKINQLLESSVPEERQSGLTQLQIEMSHKKLRLRKIWDERQDEWVDSMIPSYRTRTGRGATWLLEQGRKRGAHYVVPGIKKGSDKIAQEGRRTSRMTNTRLRTAAAERIANVAKKLQTSDSYALRSVAHGLDPLDEAQYHRNLADEFLAAEDQMGYARHTQHALQFEDVAKRGLVEQRPDGLWQIAREGDDESLRPLRKIEDLWEKVAGMRETSYLRLGILDQETILRRLNAPATVVRKALSGVEASEARAPIAASLRQIDEKTADSWLQLLDARSLVVAKEMREQAQDVLNQVAFKQANGTLNSGDRYMRDEAQKTLREVGPDVLYRKMKELRPDWSEADVEAILADYALKTPLDVAKVKRVARLEDGSMVRFSMSQSEADFWDQPWNNRMPILRDNETGNISVGDPGQIHGDLGDAYYGGAPFSNFTTQGQATLDDGIVVAVHAPPGADLVQTRLEVAAHLDDFKTRRFGSDQSSHFDPLDISEEGLQGGNYRLPGLSFKVEPFHGRFPEDGGPNFSEKAIGLRQRAKLAKKPRPAGQVGKAYARMTEGATATLKRRVSKKRLAAFTPPNPKVERDGIVILGDVTPEEWVTRVKHFLNEEEIADWANWYRNYEPLFRGIFGEHADAAMRGFAVSQANASPAEGLKSTLKIMAWLSEDPSLAATVRNGDAGFGTVVARSIAMAVNNDVIDAGIAAKLSDFIDSLVDSPTRAWMGHGDAETFGRPVAVDVHTGRDRGHVDSKVVASLREMYGLEVGRDFVVDNPGGSYSGRQYEAALEWVEGVTRHLNETRFMGRKDWQPSEVQAVGWATVQKLYGRDPQSLIKAVDRNTMSIDFEAVKGPSGIGDDLTYDEQFELGRRMEPHLKALIESHPNVHLRGITYDMGGWNDTVTPSIHVDVTGPEAEIEALTTKIAQAFDQEYVQASRTINKAGAQASLVVNSPAFSDPQVKSDFFQRLAKLSETLPRAYRLEGFMPDREGAIPGIATRTGIKNLSPDSRERFLRKYADLIERVEKDMGIEVTYSTRNTQLIIGGQSGAEEGLRAGGAGGRAELDDQHLAGIREALRNEADSIRNAPERVAPAEPTEAELGKQAERDWKALEDRVIREQDWPDNDASREYVQRFLAENPEFAPGWDDLFMRAEASRQSEYPSWARGGVDDALPDEGGRDGLLFSADEAPAGTHYYHGIHKTAGDAPGIGARGEVAISGKTPVPNRVLSHEVVGHFYQDTLGLPPEFSAKLLEHGIDDAEKFANLAEAWMFHGGETLSPDLKPAAQEITERMRAQSKLRRWKGNTNMAEAPALPEGWQDLFPMFDEMHAWQDLNGRFYAPETPGLPTNWVGPRKRLRQAFADARTFLARGVPQTLLGSDVSVKKQFKGRLMRSGYFKGDISKGIARAGMQAAKLMSFADARDFLIPLGTRVPQSAYDIPLRTNVSHGFRRGGENSGKIQRLAAVLEDLNLGGKVDLAELEQFGEAELKGLQDLISPADIGGETPQVVAAAIRNGEIPEIPNIVWVSREQFEAAGLSIKDAIPIQKRAWQNAGAAVGWTFDQMNNFVKVQLLQLNPAYYTMNFGGNAFMNITQQGFGYLPNTAMAAKLSARIGEDYARVVDHVMGSGVTDALGLKQLGPHNFLNEFSNRIVDMIPRRAAWIHEARSWGFEEDWMIKGLIEAADSGDERALAIFDTITRKAKDAIVDYDRLTPVERAVVQRGFFFYPWLKGATRWTAQFPLEHPAQATAYAALMAYSYQRSNEIIGGRPNFIELDVPVGEVERDGESVPYTVNPRQLFTFTTPFDLARTFSSLIPGVEGGAPLAEGATPVLGATLTMLMGKRLFDNQEVPQDLSTFFDEMVNWPPIVKKLVELFGPDDFDWGGLRGPATDQSNFLYPRNDFDRVLSVILGSLAPKPLNTDKANWLAAGKRGTTPSNKWEKWEEEFESAFGQAPPPQVKAAIESKIEWETMEDRGEPNDEETDTVSISRLEKKIDLLMRHKPEARRFLSRMLSDARKSDAQRREVDNAVEAWLGWNSLTSDSADMNEMARANG